MTDHTAKHDSCVLHYPVPGLAHITLNRPRQRNALRLCDMQALHQLLDPVLAADAIRVVLFTANGAGFCAGLDIQSMLDAQGQMHTDVTQAYALQETFASLMQRLRRSDKTIIAGVHGAAVGAGFGLALAADIRYASHAASFHVGAIKIGLSAGECGISYHLPRTVGSTRAFDIMLTGRPVLAEEAERCGLVAALTAPEELEQLCLERAQMVLSNSPFATKHTKQIMWRSLDASSLDEAIELENRAQILGLLTQDCAEGMRAFAEKRAPVFTGH